MRMRSWLLGGSAAGAAAGVWVAMRSVGLDPGDGAAIGAVFGFVCGLGLASIPWRSMGRYEV